MELVKSAGKRTSRLSEFLHTIFNIGLASAVLLLVYFGLPVLAYAMVVLSKWRVLAVRPRFWWANIKANLLDLLVGLSIVTMLLQASEVLWLQVFITVLYSLWLAFLKPKSDKWALFAQAGVAQFLAITALYTVSFDWPSVAVVAWMWVIGYTSAQHALGAFEDEDVSLMSLLWGLVVAELGWLAYHWVVAYSVAPTGLLKIPQIAVVVTALAYFAISAYAHFEKKGKLRFLDVKYQAIFTASIILVVLIFLNGIARG